MIAADLTAMRWNAGDETMPRFVLMTIPALALLLASGTVSAASPPSIPAANTESLRDKLKRVLAEDIIRNPRPVIAVLPDLIRRAEADPAIPTQDIITARQVLAYARTYDNDAAGGLAELDRLAADLKAKPEFTSALNETLRRKAVILSSLKRYDEAAAINLDILSREERDGRGTSALVSATLNALAVTRGRQGLYAEGAAFARRATAIGLAAPDAQPQAVADAWRTWVVLLGLSDRTNEAILEGQRALAYAQHHLGEANETTTSGMNNLAANLSEVGRYAEAEAIQRRMIDIERAQKSTQGQSLAIYLANFGDTLMLQGKVVEAEAVLRRAREMMLPVERPQRPDQLGTFTLNLGVAVFAQGRRDEALELFRTALSELARDVGTQHPTWARAKLEIAKILLDQDNVAEALSDAQAAQAVMHDRLDPLNHLRLGADLITGEALMRNGDPAGYAMARAAIAGERTVLVGSVIDPLRSSLMARERLSTFTRFARLAVERGEIADAFEALQLAQLSDLDSAGAAWAAAQAAETPELGAALAELRASATRLKQLQADRGKAVAAGAIGDLAGMDQNIATAQAEAERLASALSAKHPEYVNLLRPEPRALGDVQSALRPDQALLIAVPDDQGGVVSMLVTRTATAGQSVKLDHGQLTALATRLRESVDRGLEAPATASFDAAAAHALFAAIMPPQLDKLGRTAPELLVLAGGELASIPMAVLLTEAPRSPVLGNGALRNAPWLIRRHAIARPVSLSTLGMKAAPSRAIRFAGIGAPVLGTPRLAQADMRADTGQSPYLRRDVVDIPGSSAERLAAMASLPAAADELRAMAEAFGEGSALLLLGEEATRERILAEDLSQYRVIAFATHGLVGGEFRNLTEPALVLTPSGAASEGEPLLTASDVARLRLDADWVVLSACNTNAGQGGSAPVFSGLARAFVQAGARALLLSQWPILDNYAAPLTVETVRLSSKGMPRAQSLREAQLRLLADRSRPGSAHPAIWASFMLVGQ